VPTLEQFLTKAVAYGAEGGVHLPPAQIFGGIHPVGPPTSESIRQLQRGLLLFLSFQSHNPLVIGGGTVGLACSQNQYGVVCAQLGAMDWHPWFQSVLATGNPLTEPLAAVFAPRPRNAVGVCDQVTIGRVLWS
jgi:hypothetical protein